MVAVIASISKKPDFRQVCIHQNIEPLEIKNFSADYFRPDRQSVSVGKEVDLGRKATF